MLRGAKRRKHPLAPEINFVWRERGQRGRRERERERDRERGRERGNLTKGHLHA